MGTTAGLKPLQHLQDMLHLVARALITVEHQVHYSIACN